MRFLWQYGALSFVLENHLGRNSNIYSSLWYASTHANTWYSWSYAILYIFWYDPIQIVLTSGSA